MTQSGQGEEPSAQPAREGIVLPSDGGEPVLPGMSGPAQGPYAGNPAGGPHAGNPYGGGPYAGGPQGAGQQPGPYQGAPQPGAAPDAQYGGQGAAPAGGQAWGGPWGPEQQSGPAPAPDQGWSGAQQWPPAGQSGAGPLPAEGTPAPYTPAPAAHDAYGTPQPHSGGYGAGMPAGQQTTPGQPPSAGGAVSASGQGAPLPPAGAPAPGYGGPRPPADDSATQYLPPVAAGAGDAATQYIPPVPAQSGDDAATRYIPPAGPGALPPEAPAEATQFLGRAPQHPGTQPGSGPLPSAADPDAQATQYIPPVAAQPGAQPGYGERQPPAEFAGLFRDEPAGAPAAATQQLPQIGNGRPGAPRPGYVPPAGGRRGARDDDGGSGRSGGGRTGSRVPLFAAIGVGIAVVGIGAGALLGAGGGSDDAKDDAPANVSATAPSTTASSAAPAADPAKEQAVALDKLLADSGSSRAAVIAAVADVKSCRNLGAAAKNLRDAAQQRTGLVTRLAAVPVDKLPNNAALTGALKSAWQASASADTHYAAWADQVAGNKKLCRKGKAAGTPQTQAGNRASGTASVQKQKAAQLWNAIAQQYGLTQRQAGQL
ncbi:hypothetical protein [Streptomyces sp. NPDC014006]|uniref:hypothetical protein n=1 Tax=Streptomyces sp. NPDC014006 TaxID=3364870 RepID=UPI0036FD0145